jgi:hypothetical protein
MLASGGYAWTVIPIVQRSATWGYHTVCRFPGPPDQAGNERAIPSAFARLKQVQVPG